MMSKIPSFIVCLKKKKHKQRAIMDFNGNLLTRCGKTYLRAFLSWITGMALSMPKMLPAKQPGDPVLKWLWPFPNFKKSLYCSRSLWFIVHIPMLVGSAKEA